MDESGVVTRGRMGTEWGVRMEKCGQRSGTKMSRVDLSLAKVEEMGRIMNRKNGPNEGIL